MSGEKGACASVLLQVFDDGPSDREAVEGGGAAADLVEQDEAGGSGVGEDAGDFAHFDQESGAAAGEIIAGADPGEDAIGERKFCLARRNKRTHLRHENDQRGLPEIGGFAAHVGAGDEEKLLTARFEVEIVGNEAFAFLAQQFFDDRVAASDDQELSSVIEFWTNVAAISG